MHHGSTISKTGYARARITGDSSRVSQTRCSESDVYKNDYRRLKVAHNYKNILSEISWSSTKGMVFRTITLIGAPAKRKKKM